MRAVVLTAHGGPETVEYVTDYPDPVPGPGEVLIRIGACSLNYHDVFTRRGMPGIKVPLPVVPGLDIAGEIAALGPDVTRIEPGAPKTNLLTRRWSPTSRLSSMDGVGILKA